MDSYQYRHHALSLLTWYDQEFLGLDDTMSKWVLMSRLDAAARVCVTHDFVSV